MSRSQKPRIRAYFPRMKVRGRRRPRHGLRIVVWDSNFNAVWPPNLCVDGRMVRVDRGALRYCGRVLTAESAPYWREVAE